MNATSDIVTPDVLNVKTPSDIYCGACPRCGYPLSICWRHIGGHYGKVPFLYCSNPDGGETEAHVLQRIPEALAYGYLNRLHEVITASSQRVARLTRDLRWVQFSDLDSLIKTACPECGSAWEVIAAAGNYYARCVSPACEGHGMPHPIARCLAEAWEDLAYAGDMAYAEAEEEAGNETE